MAEFSVADFGQTDLAKMCFQCLTQEKEKMRKHRKTRQKEKKKRQETRQQEVGQTILSVFFFFVKISPAEKNTGCARSRFRI